MKRLVYGYFFLLVLTVATSACGDNNSGGVGGSGNEIAVAPMSNACATGVQTAGWNPGYQQQYGFSPYVHGQQPMNPQVIQQQGFCGCPQGTQPMCDGSAGGMTCVPVAQFGTQEVAWWRYGQNGFAFQGHGRYAGYSQGYDPRYHAATAQPGYACTQNVGQICQVGAHSCGVNSYCKPMRHTNSANNRALVGICVHAGRY